MKTKIGFKWNPDEFYAVGGFWSGYDFSADIAEIVIEVDLPEIANARELLVEKLKAEKSTVITEATKKAEQIEEKIQQLLALPASVAG